ncbi:hypothetical protein [Streptomyces sp. NPDC046985]|uniref:hypothetical protein n=1 Tax=Streptomyces sp. NPDC046985 TaxID=3155377 RepID=UPI0033F65E18
MHIPSRAVRAARLLGVAALPLALAACGSADASSATAPASPSSVSAAKDPDAGLLTGAQLKKALAPASSFAAGFTLTPGGARDTGDTFTSPSSAAAAAPDCAKLNGTGWIEVTGVSGVSFAQNDYVDKNTSEDVAQEIDAYRGTASADVLKGLARKAAACTGFTDSDTHSKVKVAGARTPGVGDAAYTVTLTDSAWENGATLIAARVGTNVVSVMSTDGHDDGAATARKLVREVVASLKSLPQTSS